MNVNFRLNDGHIFSKTYKDEAELIDELNYYFINVESEVDHSYSLIPVKEIIHIRVEPTN